MAGSTAETAEQAKEKLGEAAQKGKETVSGSASKPAQVGIRAPSTPDHKVGAMSDSLALIWPHVFHSKSPFRVRCSR